jgi:glutamyl-tRNA synthetase
VPPRTIVVPDALQGESVQDVAATVGDFVVKRGDGTYGYQLACVVDDLAMGVTEVVRGADLLDSTPRQALLAELLGATPPGFAHVPLVLSPDGSRLAKRTAGTSLRDHRDAGVPAAAVVRALATLLGLDPADTPRALLARFERRRLAGRRAVRLPGSGTAVRLA